VTSGIFGDLALRLFSFVCLKSNQPGIQISRTPAFRDKATDIAELAGFLTLRAYRRGLVGFKDVAAFRT